MPLSFSLRLALRVDFLMPFNLIHEAWLPVRRASGQGLWIKPADITADLSGDPVVALDFPRPDWNAAITEFLIGLFTCALAPEDEKKWRRYWLDPPSSDALAEKLAHLAFAFNLDGDGPRAFQDIDLAPGVARKDISKLLIDGPSANSLVNNTDHFNKRGMVRALSLPYASAALISLQTYAPYDSSKHVASIRSVGPLTTLVGWVDGSGNLWKKIWSNSPSLVGVGGPPAGLNPSSPAWARIFPWLASTKAFGKGKICGIDQGHEVLMPFFSIPRRLRLAFTTTSEGSAATVEEFSSDTFGPDYYGWHHPLSPYFDTKAGGLAPVKAENGLSFYRDWLGVWGGGEKQYPALNVRAWHARADRLGLKPKSSVVCLDASGFIFKQAQPVAWVESRIPFYTIAGDDARNGFYLTARNLIGGSETAANELKEQIRIPRFGFGDGKGGYKHELSREVAPKVGREQADRFWRGTEGEFRKALDRLAEMEDPSDQSHEIKKTWLNIIKRAALRIFDDDVAPEDAWNDDPKRLVYARASLALAFIENGKVWKSLGLPPPLKPNKPPRKSASAGARP
jgi:CRISPR system Cascade subunit CasA